MLFIPNQAVDYPQMKARLQRRLWVWDGLVALALAVFAPSWLIPYAMGALLGYGYLLSLFFTSEFPQRRLAVGMAITRMAIVSFLIVWLGQFRLLETCVVFCGFLSYKVVLVLEFVQYSVGIKRNRGQ